jgi:hypothetical protein
VRQCSSSFKLSCMRPTERSGLSEVEYRVIRALAKYNPYSTNESSEVKEVEYMILIFLLHKSTKTPEN